MRVDRATTVRMVAILQGIWAAALIMLLAQLGAAGWASWTAAPLCGLWVWWLASRRGAASASLSDSRDDADGTPDRKPAAAETGAGATPETDTAGPRTRGATSTAWDHEDMISRLVDLQLDYLSDLDSRRVLARALADIRHLAGASFAALCEVRTSSSGAHYAELLESEAVCWSDTMGADDAPSAFRAVSRDIVPVLDAVVADRRPVLVDRQSPRFDVSATFAQRGCLAMPLLVEDRLVGVVAVGESVYASNEIASWLSPYLRTCAGLIDAAKHQAQHEQAIEEAKARETLYRDLFDSASDLIHAVRPDGGFAYVNKAWLQTLGYAEGELEDLRVWDVVDEAAHTYYRTVFALATPGAPPEPRAMTFIAKDGRRIAVEGAEGCRYVDGVPAVTRAIFRDVTRHKAEEDALRAAKASAEEAARAKGLFLANMSHELRTPMNAVIGMTNLLADTTLSGDQRDLVGTIHQAGESLLGVIDSILDFSKIESGKLQLERAPFAVREVVEHALDLVAKPAVDKGLELAYVMAPGVPEAVVGDVTRVKQILVNLLTNAVKFTSQGEVVVNVDGRQRGTEYELYVRVRDTGIGIPADRVGQLFQSFTQVDAGTTRQFGGTGLGLAICRRLAELMGGNVWVESKLGVGSVFYFTAVVKTAGSRGADSHFEARAALSGKRVLIVAERATTRRVLLDHVTAWGMLPTALLRGDQVQSDLNLGAVYDLVVLDTDPSYDEAVAVLSDIRSRAGLERMPAVLLGAIGQAGEDAVELERCGWTVKPIKQRPLQRSLVDALEGRTRVDAVAPSGPRIVARPHRLLLTEDNAINQQVALRMLARLGYSADVADNGEAAVAAVARTDYDVVLMDVQMPVLDGFAATARIRASHRGGRRPYVIGMTALALAGDRERCLAAGMDDYVAKPIRPELLQAALERATAGVSPTAAGGTPRATVAASPAAEAKPGQLPDERPVAPAPAQTATSSTPVIASADLLDASAIDRLYELSGPEDETFVLGLVQKWLTEYPSRLSDIGAALEVGDAPLAERLAHTLKSSCGILGALRMAAACQRVESAAASGHLDEARAGLGVLLGTASETAAQIAIRVGCELPRSA